MRVKAAKGPNALQLPAAGFQQVVEVDGKATELRVTIDLQVSRLQGRNPRAYSRAGTRDGRGRQPACNPRRRPRAPGS